MKTSNKPKVSVIVPIYKAEKFIERCCVSLFEQTLDHIEYIFVDDCSPDNSVENIRNVAKRYPERESSIKILTHTVNRGVSFSRQQGLEVATGEFVIHCDSDDWVEREMYNVMYETAVREDADVVCCGFTVDYSDGKVQSVRYTNVGEMKEVSFNIAPLTGSVWNKLVRRSMLVDAGVSFPQNINWGEDFCVAIAGLILSKKTICLEKCFYHYWQNSASITHNVSKEKCMELVRVANFVEIFIKKKCLQNVYHEELNYLKFQVKKYFLIFPEVRDLKLWKNIYPECNMYIINYNIPLYLKIVSMLIFCKLFYFANVMLKVRDRVSNLMTPRFNAFI